MLYSNVNYTVVYIDPSVSEAGDGSAPDHPLADLPGDIADISDNTCFLIRRTEESASCVLPVGSRSDIHNIMFLGMPIADDAMYEFVPAEAKEAWGADSPMYANIRNDSSSSRFQLNSELKNFVLHRIYLFRDNINADAYNFYLYTQDSSRTCVLLEHCKFGSKGLDIDQEAYTGDPVTRSRLKAYFYVYYARIFAVRDCVINHTVTGNGNDAHGVYCYFADIADAEDIRVFSPMYSASFDSRALVLSEEQKEGIECNIRNITQKILFNGEAEYIPLLLTLFGHLNTRVENISVELSGALGETRPSSLRLYSRMMNFYYLQDFHLKNITVNLPGLWRLDTGGRVLYLGNCQAGNYLPGAEKKIENVTITLAAENGIGDSNSRDEIDEAGSEYAVVYFSIDRNENSNYWKMPSVDNIKVTHPRGRALFASNCRITRAEFSGNVSLSTSLADITSLKSAYSGYLLFASDGSTVRIHKLEGVPDPEDSSPAIGSSFRERSDVFVDESNLPLRPLSISTGEDYCIYHSFTCNSEQTAGHFVQRSVNAVCDTWNVHREGGASACLKLWNTGCDTMRTMVMGRKPFKGMVLTPSAGGRQMLKLHVAWKGYGNETDMYRRLMVSATVNGTDGDRTSWSTVDGRWNDDSSATWINDSELTQKCLEMPLDVLESETVEVRIYFSWYGENGFVYIDPVMELTPLN